jgi:predicted DNA-binding protein (MmcQ/YjbR family)
MPANEGRVLEKLRAICLAMPGTIETQSWGHPNFRAGRRMYAAFDEYGGERYIAFIAPPPILEKLEGEPHFRRAGHREWMLRDLAAIDWKELRSLLVQAHALATAKKPPRSAAKR